MFTWRLKNVHTSCSFKMRTQHENLQLCFSIYIYTEPLCVWKTNKQMFVSHELMVTKQTHLLRCVNRKQVMFRPHHLYFFPTCFCPWIWLYINVWPWFGLISRVLSSSEEQTGVKNNINWDNVISYQFLNTTFDAIPEGGNHVLRRKHHLGGASRRTCNGPIRKHAETLAAEKLTNQRAHWAAIARAV